MWSLGCVIAELFLGWPLYPGSSEYDQVGCYRNDPKFWTDRSEQTQIRLLLEEQSDQDLHCLPFRLHRLDSLLYEKRPRGRAFSAPDFGSRGRGFESRWRRDSSRA